MTKNRHGLDRNIPAAVKREVRQRSKYGCVICRIGFYHYEHIEPFENVDAHRADNICCLCGGCHDGVTRGQLSKGAVIAAYQRIQTATADEVGPPFGPLDFHTGTATLRIGGLRYPSTVRTVVRYHGVDVISLNPGEGSEPGSISAVFTDDDGAPILELRDNEWVGPTEGWDITVIGQRLAGAEDYRSTRPGNPHGIPRMHRHRTPGHAHW